MSPTVVILLLFVAVFGIVGVVLVFGGLGVMMMMLRSGKTPPSGAASVAPATPPPKVTPRPAPSASPPPKPANTDFMALEEEDGKTEVFDRGSIDWSDEPEEGEATEVFHPDSHSGVFD